MRISFWDTFSWVHGVAPIEKVSYGESNADIFSPACGFIGGFDLTMQIQVGCPGGCLFCYVSSGGLFTPASVRGPKGTWWGSVVRDKLHVDARLRAALNTGRIAQKAIYFSGVTDPYAGNPKILRSIWNILGKAPSEERPRRMVVQTRFRPDRDRKLMAAYERKTYPSDGGPAVVINYSLGTDRNDLIQAWERATPSFEQRLTCLSNLRDAGLFVVVTLSPMALWRDLEGVLKTLNSMGVAYISILFFKDGTKSANTPQPFLKYLRENYPCVLDEKWQAERLEEARSVFGSNRVLVGQRGFASLTAPHLIV